jgi:hypothetical protein
MTFYEAQDPVLFKGLRRTVQLIVDQIRCLGVKEIKLVGMEMYKCDNVVCMGW